MGLVVGAALVVQGEPVGDGEQSALVLGQQLLLQQLASVLEQPERRDDGAPVSREAGGPGRAQRDRVLPSVGTGGGDPLGQLVALVTGPPDEPAGVRASGGELGVRDPGAVVRLAGRRHVAATRFNWPHAADLLAGSRGMGEHLSRWPASPGPGQLPGPT